MGKHFNEVVWKASIGLYGFSLLWGLLSVFLEANLMHRHKLMGSLVGHLSWRRITVRIFILMQTAVRITWFGLNPTGDVSVKTANIFRIMDILAWSFQFCAFSLIVQSLMDVLANNQGRDSYIRFETKRTKVWFNGAVLAAGAILSTTAVLIVDGVNALFVATCFSFAVSILMARFTYLLHLRTDEPSHRLILLSVVCVVVFSIPVGNGMYLRFNNFVSDHTWDVIVYPWFIYQVPDIIPDLVIFICFVSTSRDTTLEKMPYSTFTENLLDTSSREFSPSVERSSRGHSTAGTTPKLVISENEPAS
jgi:hypothetical protein